MPKWLTTMPIIVGANGRYNCLITIRSFIISLIVQKPIACLGGETTGNLN